MSSNNPQVGDPLSELNLFNQKPATNPLSELEAFSQKPIRDPNVTRISAGPGAPYMPQAQTPSRYTGNYAEEYMAQFVGSIASGISSDYVKAPAKQGLPGETAIRTAGRVIGSVPNLLFGAGIINAGIKGAVARIPKAAKAIMTVARGIFTEEAVRGTINNSVDFYEALKSGDMDAVEYAAAGAIIDAAFAGLMAKGWIEDAKTLKTMRDKMMADRFANAKNITPEPPKTLAEEAAKTEAVKVAEATEPQGPTPELQTNVDAKESTKETVEAIKKVKVKKVPETPEELKARMAKVRAARRVKVTPEEVGKAKTVAEAKELLEVGAEESKEEISKLAEELQTKVKAGEAKPELLQTEISKVMEKAEVPTEPTKYKSIQELAADWGCTTESAKVLVDLINVSGARKAKSVEELGQLLNSNIDKVDQSRWSGLETAGDTLKNAINNKLFLADLLENKKVPTKTTEPKVNRITKVQQARIDKAKALAAEGKDPGQISYRLNMREEEVRSILGMEPAEIVLPNKGVPKTVEEGIARQEALIKSLAESEARKAKEPPIPESPFFPPGMAEKPVKPSEKIDYLDELNQFKAEQQPVRPKIVQTEPTPAEPSTGLTVTPADMKALEAKFGPDWDELSDKQIAEFLSGKQIETKPVVETPVVEEPSDIEKYYNKDIEKITQAEFDKYFDMVEVGEVGVKTEPVTSVDIQTGTPEPSAMVTEDSPFRTSREVTVARTKSYNTSKSVAKSVDDALKILPNRPLKDIFVTTQKLLNDVNRWLDGEEVDITSTRNFLSDIAARADQFRDQIVSYSGNEQDFYEWKDMVSDAANWAVKVKSNITFMRSGGPSTDEIVAYIKKSINKIEGAVRRRNIESNGKIYRAGQELFPTDEVLDEIRTNVGNRIRENEDVIAQMEELKRQGKGNDIYAVRSLLPNDSRANSADDAINTRRRLIRDSQQYIKDAEDANRLYNEAIITKDPNIRLMRSGGPSTEELINILIKAGRAYKASRDKARAAKKKRASEVHSETKEELIRALVERSGNISKALTSPEFFDKYGDVGYRVVRDMYLSRGGNPRATNAYRQFAKEVYGGLNKKESQIVDDLMSALRMIDIGKYKTEKQFKFPEDETPAKSATYLATFAELEGLTPEKAYELYHENEDGTVGGRVGAGIEATKRIIDHMRDEGGGLIGNKEHDDLVSHRYRRLGTIDKPATLAEVLDKKYEQKIGDINRSTHDSGIDRLSSKEGIFEPSWKLMFFETASRAYGRIANNEAGHTLLELARTHPENPFVHTKIRPTGELEEQPNRKNKLVDSIEIKRLEQGISDYEIRGMIRAQTKKSSSYKKATTDDLKVIDKALGEKSKGYTGKAEKLPTGQIPTYVYDKGHRTTVWMEPSFAKEWIVNSRDITPRAARLAKWATMAPVTRTFATGIEPAFAFTNPFRDALQIWFAAREFKDGQWKPVYNEHSPKAIEQMSEDIATVAADALLRTGWHNDYIDYGGGMDFLVLQGRPFQRGLHIDNSIDEVFNYAGYLNESSEIVTRLAIMVRSLKNQAAEKGMTLEEARKNPEMMRNAVFAARDYMDFAQGGWAIKLIDQAVPYFNASLVAGRTFVRSFKNNGMNAQSWYKLAQFALLAGGLYFLSREWASNTMKELEGDPRTQNNFIIPLGDIFGYEDNTGQMRYPFLMIPTDQSLRPLKKFIEFGVDEMLGKTPDAKGAINSLWQVSPLDISSLPPLEAAIYEYFSNYDLYRMQNIRREGQVFNYPMSGTEFNANTPPALVELGRITGASPERIRVAMSEMISTNSTWSYMLGEAYNKVFSQMPQDERDKHLSESLARYPVIKKFIGLTSPYSQFAAGISKDNEKVTWEMFNQRNGLDTLIDGMNKKSKAKVYTVYGTYEPTRDGIETYMRSFEDKQIYDRLNDRLKFAEKTAGMPHRGLWMQMQAQPVEARAKTYIREVMSSDKMMEEFQQVNRKFAGTDRGLSTESFRIEVRKQLSK